VLTTAARFSAIDNRPPARPSPALFANRKTRQDRHGSRNSIPKRPAGLLLRPPGGGSLPLHLLTRRRLRPHALSNTQNLQQPGAGEPMGSHQMLPPRLGTWWARPATTAARLSALDVSPGETITCTISKPQSAARWWSSRMPRPNDPQDFSFTASGLSPTDFQPRTTTPTPRSRNTQGRSTTSCRALAPTRWTRPCPPGVDPVPARHAATAGPPGKHRCQCRRRTVTCHVCELQARKPHDRQRTRSPTTHRASRSRRAAASARPASSSNEQLRPHPLEYAGPSTMSIPAPTRSTRAR